MRFLYSLLSHHVSDWIFLELPEPRYGRPRKFDPYVALKAGGRQYPNPALTSRERWAQAAPAEEPAAVLTTADAAAAEVNALFNAAETETRAEAKDGAHHHADAAEQASNEVTSGLAPEEARA